MQWPEIQKMPYSPKEQEPVRRKNANVCDAGNLANKLLVKIDIPILHCYEDASTVV